MNVDPKDVKYTGQVCAVSRKRRARQSRELDDRDYTYTFQHVPTGKTVTIRTGIVHWSKKEANRQRESLRIGLAVTLLKAL